jgi:putative SOS response-associated peptidase YedK
MCGLYSLTRKPEEIRALFQHVDEPDFPPRAHVAPGQPIAAVRMENGARRFALLRWGFIPSWVKEVKLGKPLINARGETVLEKPSFRNAMRRRRCLVPADGYYEWSGEEGRKTPYSVQRKDKGLFALAGLWEHWMGADGSEIETAVLMTIAPNAELATIHDRMPVMLNTLEERASWLDERTPIRALRSLLGPAPDALVSARRVSRAVSNARNEGPRLLDEIPDESVGLGL